MLAFDQLRVGVQRLAQRDLAAAGIIKVKDQREEQQGFAGGGCFVVYPVCCYPA
jgi:hypothetical protein